MCEGLSLWGEAFTIWRRVIRPASLLPMVRTWATRATLEVQA